MSDEWFISICWSSLLFGIFMIKKCVVINLTSSVTLQYDYVIKTIETFNLPQLINNSVTTDYY